MSNLSTNYDIFIIEKVGQFLVCNPAPYIVKPCRLIVKMLHSLLKWFLKSKHVWPALNQEATAIEIHQGDIGNK